MAKKTLSRQIFHIVIYSLKLCLLKSYEELNILGRE